MSEQKNVQQDIEDFLDTMYSDSWPMFSVMEGRFEVEPNYWATTVGSYDLVDRAATIDVCMQMIMEEKSIVTRVMLAQWVAAALGGPCDLLTSIALRGYKET